MKRKKNIFSKVLSIITRLVKYFCIYPQKSKKLFFFLEKNKKKDNNTIGGERKSVKVVLQDGIKDCGICCLLSIIRYYGGDVSKEYLREITYTTKDGVSLFNLMEAAKKIGFDAIGLTGKIEEIDVNNLPCITHFIINKNYKHFVVLYQINKEKKQAIIMDPAKGKQTLSFSEFKLLATSNYLFLTPIKKIPKIIKKKILIQNIKKVILSNKIIFFQIILLSFISLLLNIISSFHFKYILEYSINFQISKNIIWITKILIWIYLFKNINIFMRNILINKWNSLLDYETTTKTYNQILLLPYLYYKNRTTGEVISRFQDLNIIRSFISNLFIGIMDFINLLVFTIILNKYNNSITKYLFIILMFLSIYELSTSKYKKRRLKRIRSKQDTIDSYIIQATSNVDTIKGSHLEKRMFDKFKIKYSRFIEEIYNYNFLLQWNNFIKNNLNDLSNTILYGYGSYLVIKRKISLNNIILYQTFFNYLKMTFYNIISIIENYNSYKVSKDRIEELFMIHTDKFIGNYYYLKYNLQGKIEIKSLNYKIGNKIIFKNLNLEINQGEKILLSGASGSGKSTLVKMLLRYIEIDYGNIRIDNIDINHYHLENIRTNITYVTGNEYLFTDTIKNNILMYKNYDEEDFEKVCKISLLDDIIKNNHIKYNSLVEENGFNYSNGERQRIILARSIIRKSSIYIFDEALAGIDINREKKILTSIFDYLKDKTIIVISHRFNNKKIFDRVLKLENGRINETKKI